VAASTGERAGAAARPAAPEAGWSRKGYGWLVAKKQAGQKISMLTCYDYPTACLEDQARIDVIFVGDSVGTNVLGYASEREVTMADMVHHLKAVRRGVRQAYLLVDLPYGSYDTPELALEHARLLLEHGADAVKLEGGQAQAGIVQHLTAHGIAVCGHIGFTPQTMRRPGRPGRVYGRSVEQARDLLRNAAALESAGAIMVVLELVPEPLARLVTERLRIPTIGIGAGRYCDGQVLVVNDVLGITPFAVRLARRYQQFGELGLEAIRRYRDDVERGTFPTQENTFPMDEAVLADLAQSAL
jgi:3-methyl-2-oxobutanoate hydroxymethyltransferase